MQQLPANNTRTVPRRVIAFLVIKCTLSMIASMDPPSMHTAVRVGRRG